MIELGGFISDDDALAVEIQREFDLHHRRLIYERALERLCVEAVTEGDVHVCGLLADQSPGLKLLALKRAHEMLAAHFRWEFWSALRQPTLPFPGWDDDRERMRRLWLREFRKSVEELFVAGDKRLAVYAVTAVVHNSQELGRDPRISMELSWSQRARTAIAGWLCAEYAELRYVYGPPMRAHGLRTGRRAPGPQGKAG